jgi:hypothetical protein
VLLLSVGLWVATVKRDFASVNDVLASPAILTMVVGILIVATALIGIIGALREHLVCLRVVSMQAHNYSIMAQHHRQTVYNQTKTPSQSTAFFTAQKRLNN